MEPIQTELCAFKTPDGRTLHGLLFRPGKEEKGDLALLLVHGVAMSFYTGPLPILGQALAVRGYPCFCINTRGHDWISRAGNLTAFGGAAYENFEDCPLDLNGAFSWLKERGYRRFVLVGHSLGSVKSLFYQGSRQRPDVVGVVSCSAPRQFYSARAEEQPDFPKRMEEAEKLVAEGKGEELSWVPASGATGLFTARTYVSKYGKHERNNVRPHAGRLGCPLLVIVGAAETPLFLTHAKELSDAAGKMATLRIIPGAEHFYRGHEEVLVETVAAWLGKTARGEAP